MAVEGIDDQFLHPLWYEAMFQDCRYYVMLTVYIADDLEGVVIFKLTCSVHVHAL